MKADDRITHPLHSVSEAELGTLRRLLEECLERIDREGQSGLEAFCAKHSKYADRIRSYVESLRRLGMLPGADGVVRDAIPERLGEFRLLERLGGGGMGVVYLAEQETLGRQVALKLIRPGQLDLRQAHDRFRREVETIARLQHPGIVPIYSVGEHDGVPYFAMERVLGCSLLEAMRKLDGRNPESLRGADLADVVARSVPATPGRPGSSAAVPLPAQFAGTWVEVSLRLVLQVAHALSYAHSQGVLHRDVKPSNVMVTVDGRALLVDFGLATGEGVTRLTRTGSHLGSLPYMSPEQVRGDHDRVSAQSDLYSLGVTLHELLGLQHPFGTQDTEATRQRILRGEASDLRRQNSAVPRDVEIVCRTALDPDPARRYASAAKFARDLDNLLSFRPIEARPLGPLLRLHRFTQRHAARSVALGLALLLLLAGLPSAAVLQRWATRRIEAALAREEATNTELAETNLELGRIRDDVEGHHVLAETRFEELIGLSDLKRWRDLEDEARTLWPARAALMARMDSWVERAELLVSHLAVHRRSLGRLKESDAGADAVLRGVDLAWWRMTLQDLVARIETFADPDPLAGTLADVRERRRRAQSIEQETVTDYQTEWDEAIDGIATSEQYAGLELRPIVGIVPLGPDPASGLWEFWHVESGAMPEPSEATGEWVQDQGSGIVLVLIPGGETRIGGQASDPEQPLYAEDARPNEGLRELELDPFLISKYEVTRAQWSRWMHEDPSNHLTREQGSGDDAGLHPVQRVSWSSCRQYLERLGLNLPTEAQWEHAARAGTTSPWWTGERSEQLRGKENLADRRFAQTLRGKVVPNAWDDGYAATAPVGSFAANPFGLQDVLGNVAERCADTYFFLPQDLPRAGDGLVSVESLGSRRVVRGGSFQNPASRSRSSWRDHHLEEEEVQSYVGCRPAKRIVER